MRFSKVLVVGLVALGMSVGGAAAAQAETIDGPGPNTVVDVCGYNNDHVIPADASWTYGYGLPDNKPPKSWSVFDASTGTEWRGVFDSTPCPPPPPPAAPAPAPVVAPVPAPVAPSVVVAPAPKQTTTSTQEPAPPTSTETTATSEATAEPSAEPSPSTSDDATAFLESLPEVDQAVADDVAADDGVNVTMSLTLLLSLAGAIAAGGYTISKYTRR